MLTSTFHLAIIMDGNGRWATRRGLPRLAGHREGVQALRRTLEAAPSLGVTTLTVYAFSSDNWKRPSEEVSGLFRLLEHYLTAEIEECLRNGVRLSVIGRRDRLPPSVTALITGAERRTRQGSRLHLRLAIDYSARDLLLGVVARKRPPRTREDLSSALGPDVDLLIRTGGEQRLSDFLLWECAYAEILFLPCFWPDFGPADLRAAVDWYASRQRRFGALAAESIPA